MITKHDILAEFNDEVPATRKMLERVPFDKLDWVPTAKSMPLGRLAIMIGSMPSWFTSMVQEDAIDTGTFKQPPQPKDASELVEMFDKGVADFQAATAAMNEDALQETWSLRMGGKTVMEMPRGAALRQTINHLVHHRAQLGVYLKINGIAHPAVYGPSGDEQ